MPGKRGRPTAKLTYHVWRDLQDTKIMSDDGSCAFYLERPLTAGRLDPNWNYRLQLGDLGDASGGITVMTLRREDTRYEGLRSQVYNIYSSNNQLAACMRWLGDSKKLKTGKNSGTKKYLFDWQGRELLWDSRLTISGTDHYCTDPGNGDVLCYFRSVLRPLAKDGKIEINAKIKDETTRLVLLASCLAYREWADKRQTAIYVS